MNKTEPVYDPGKGKRSPADWGKWLLNQWGLQRQMLHKMNNGHDPEHGRSQMYQGTVPSSVKAKRRAKNKVARRSRRVNRMHAKR